METLQDSDDAVRAREPLCVVHHRGVKCVCVCVACVKKSDTTTVKWRVCEGKKSDTTTVELSVCVCVWRV